ncbi:MAG: N-acetyltransferase [Candidatus Glassbacteria bacterium]|nr:N-acetyltransferase [Candidatus Glassbacteria bacterium]
MEGAPKQKKYFAHETAVIDEGASIGEGTRIWHFSHVMGGARIGRDCNFGQNVVVHSTAVVGNGVKVQNNVSIYDAVVLEDDVFCGPSMVFTNVINPRSHTPRKDEYMTTLVRKGATIGANATVLCGNTIGEHAFVGAASLVTRDVPDHALVFGVPARFQAWMCKCGVRLKTATGETGSEQVSCGACGRKYSKEGNRVALVGEPSS